MTLGSLKRWQKILLATILTVGLATTFSWGYWATIGHRFTTITPDRVYQSAVIPAEGLSETVRDKRIKVVIDLRTNESTDFPPQQKGRLLEKLGVYYYHLPSKQVPEDKTVDAFLKIAANLEQTVTLIAGARAFIGHDSGPLHIVSAFGRPVFGLYLPGEPHRIFPQGNGQAEVFYRTRPQEATGSEVYQYFVRFLAALTNRDLTTTSRLESTIIYSRDNGNVLS